MKNWKRLSLSILGGVLITSLLLAVDFLGHKGMVIADTLRYFLMPGIAFSLLFYPDGVHSDGYGFFYLLAVFNVGFYTLTVYVLLRLAAKIRRKNRQGGSGVGMLVR